MFSVHKTLKIHIRKNTCYEQHFICTTSMPPAPPPCFWEPSVWFVPFLCEFHFNRRQAVLRQILASNNYCEVILYNEFQRSVGLSKKVHVSLIHLRGGPTDRLDNFFFLLWSELIEISITSKRIGCFQCPFPKFLRTDASISLCFLFFSFFFFVRFSFLLLFIASLNMIIEYRITPCNSILKADRCHITELRNIVLIQIFFFKLQLLIEEAGIKRSLIKTIRKRQLQFLGHLNRHKGLEHLALTGKIDGNRSRGRQRIKFLDSLNKWTSVNLNKKPKDNSSFLAMSEDRDVWRAMITDVCFRPGTWRRRRYSFDMVYVLMAYQLPNLLIYFLYHFVKMLMFTLVHPQS